MQAARFLQLVNVGVILVLASVGAVHWMLQLLAQVDPLRLPQ